MHVACMLPSQGRSVSGFVNSISGSWRLLPPIYGYLDAKHR